MIVNEKKKVDFARTLGARLVGSPVNYWTKVQLRNLGKPVSGATPMGGEKLDGLTHLSQP